MAERWIRQASTASQLLRSEEYEGALRILEPLTTEMLDNIDSGKSAAQVLGTVVVYRAIAYAGLGRNDDALWYWDVAVALFPPFANSDMSPFHAAGAFLKEHPLAVRMSQAIQLNPEITEPRVKYRTLMHPPRGSAFRHGKFDVEAQITTSGAAAAPRIISEPPTPMLAFNAFESLRQWRFEPAKKDGVPVQVRLKLSVDYSSP